MGGGSGGGGSGGRSGGGGGDMSKNGDAGQSGEVVRAANEANAPKVKRVLFADGKVQPGTKAYEAVQKQKADADKTAASNKRIAANQKKLKFDAIHRSGMWNYGVKKL